MKRRKDEKMGRCRMKEKKEREGEWMLVKFSITPHTPLHETATWQQIGDTCPIGLSTVAVATGYRGTMVRTLFTSRTSSKSILARK